MKADRGFSLIEVVVALLVFQVGVLASVSLLGGALRTLRAAEEIERGIDGAQAIVDSVHTGSLGPDGQSIRLGLEFAWESVGGRLIVRVHSLGDGGLRGEYAAWVEQGP